jgi:colanic acid biosynthesis glycosyl transferase WcaI
MSGTLRILLHSNNYAPELISTGKYNGEMCEWLAARDHEVRVVVPQPFYPQWQVMEGYSAWAYRRERIRGVEVWRSPTWVPAEPSTIERLLHLASFAVSSLPSMLRQVRWRPDVVIVTEPTLLCFPQAWLTARLSGAKLWLHVLDFELDAALQLEMLSTGSSVRRFLYMAEYFLLRRADRVSTISEKMMQRLSDKGVPGDDSWLFPNWADTDLVQPLAQDNEVRRELGATSEQVLVLYAGNMGEKQGLELILDAADQLKKRAKIRFAIVGGGPARKKLERAARQQKLHNVRFLPVQPLERLPLMLAAADIHLVIQRREAADLVMPSKLTNILAAGRPSVATVDPGTAISEILNGYGCGITVLPESATELTSGIVTLAEDARMRNQLGRNARRYAESYLKKDKILIDFENRLQNLVKVRGK